MAGTAYDVLSNNYGTDAQVQQMVKYILGDGTDIQDKVDKAKGEYSCGPGCRPTWDNQLRQLPSMFRCANASCNQTGILGAVKSYDADAYPFLGAPFIENTDLVSNTPKTMHT